MEGMWNTYTGSVFTKEITYNLPVLMRNSGSSEREELKEISISWEMVLGKVMWWKADK